MHLGLHTIQDQAIVVLNRQLCLPTMPDDLTYRTIDNRQIGTNKIVLTD